ncbi:MAG: winged helix-turn-helix domain-containing protein [Rhodothermales bacterium]|nr:winged helix-turn-helix domain-containing protein [Rhodothermales bacterium]
MPSISEHAPLSLVLVADSQEVVAAVRASCPPPHRIDVYSLAEVVDARNTLSGAGRGIIEAAPQAEVLLVEWDLARAPVINTLCYHVRAAVRVPLVAVCRAGAAEQVAALAAGADDAMTLPVYPALLRARAVAYRRLIEAVRATEGEIGGREPDVVEAGTLRLDRAARRVYLGSQPLELTFREYTLMAFFMERPGVACSRDLILDEVWGIQFDTGTNMVDVYVYFLRKKLAAHGFEGKIETVRGYGYRFVSGDAQEPPETG